MSVLVDRSIWIAYFRGHKGLDVLDWLIDEDLVVTNDLILAELLPAIRLRGLSKLSALVGVIPRLTLDIDWNGVVDLQMTCLRHGINKVGIPDLIIAQNAMAHSVTLFSTDKHFRLLAKHVRLQLH